MSEIESSSPPQSTWQKNKVPLTGMTLFCLGILLGFTAGWFIGRQMSGQSLVPVPIDEPGPDIFIPYTSPSPNTIAPGEPGTIEPAWPMPPDDGAMGVACTMEAMLCPDGSYVGRQPPSCQFAPCPGQGSGTSGSSGGSAGSGVQMTAPVAPTSTASPAVKR